MPCERPEIGVIHIAVLDHLRVVDDVAQTNVKVTVHALQRADHKAVFWSRDWKRMSHELGRPGPVNQRVDDCELFAGLTEALHVDLDQFWQTRNFEVPFVCQTVSPAAFRNLCLETLFHDGHNVGGFRVGEKVEVAAQVRPVVERLDHDYFARPRQRLANGLEACQSAADAGTLLLQFFLSPICREGIVLVRRYLLEGGKCAHDDVMGMSQRAKFRQALGERTRGCAVGSLDTFLISGRPGRCGPQILQQNLGEQCKTLSRVLHSIHYRAS